jgi:hypothetical protein
MDYWSLFWQQTGFVSLLTVPFFDHLVVWVNVLNSLVQHVFRISNTFLFPYIVEREASGTARESVEGLYSFSKVILPFAGIIVKGDAYFCLETMVCEFNGLITFGIVSWSEIGWQPFLKHTIFKSLHMNW